MLCRSLFAILYFFFWPLCCLFFFDIRFLIAPLVSSNSSCKIELSVFLFGCFYFFCCCMYIFCTYITNEIQEFNINMPIKLDKLCFHLRFLHMVNKPCWPLFPLLVYGFFCNEFVFLKIVKTKHRISRLVIQQIKVTSIFSFLVYYLLTLLNLYFLKLFLFILPDEECYAKFNLQNS